MLHIDAGTAVGVVVTSWPVCAAAVPYPSKTGAFKKMIVDGVLVCHQWEVDVLGVDVV